MIQTGNKYIIAITTLPIKTGLRVSRRYLNSIKKVILSSNGIMVLPIKGISMLLLGEI